MTKQTRYQQGRQELFGLLSQEAGVSCMDSTLDEIERCVLSYAGPSAAAVATKLVAAAESLYRAGYDAARESRDCEPTDCDEWGLLMGALPHAEGEAVATVPIHPRLGPLWAETLPAGSEMHRAPYPTMNLYAGVPAPQAAVPEGWRIVEKKNCFVLSHGNNVVASLAGPDAEANAARIATMLAAAPVAPQVAVELLPSMREFLKEGIHDATKCEDADMDDKFAEQAHMILTTPLYTHPAPQVAVPDLPAEITAEGYGWHQIAAGEVPVDDAPAVLRAIAKHMLAAAPAAPTPDDGELPSDEELLAWAGEEEFFLFCDQEEFLDIAKSVLRRYARASAVAQPDIMDEPAEPDVIERMRRGHEANLYDDATDEQVGDLVMLVRRLARALHKSAPNNTLPAQAADYLDRIGLPASPLRAAQRPVSDPDGLPTIEDYQSLCAALYQACGAYDMPGRIMDVLSKAQPSPEPFRHLLDDLLPVSAPDEREIAAQTLDIDAEYKAFCQWCRDAKMDVDYRLHSHSGRSPSVGAYIRDEDARLMFQAWRERAKRAGGDA